MGDISRYKGGACKKMKGGGAVKAPRQRAKKMAIGGAMPTPPDVYPGKPGAPYETPRPVAPDLPAKPPVPLETPRPMAAPIATPPGQMGQPRLRMRKRGGKV